MSFTKTDKNELIVANHVHPTDTGSPEVQVAILSARIKYLTEHLNKHKKDFATRRGLIKMVGRRRKLLRYLLNNAPERHAQLVERLGLKK
ncbi:30S ribosomal protein S15 [bacterium (Candidatus Blackallbacteria) CG17_big_fil_post_rev_8_21_14_2_50_48_46]|uniref:Small ribosomal subunit protein uS15 n=1 Tax=bacterium (Candidatus Blackallbacteria) CG17_big_fil_post_rev_8_21_14_2_50_48_46 TaxID=2014261 RepID=A0A2M7G0I1_9BACT|nr:MAG: 30S ribosomal protein S15 [bacterium (Candidatus Blackallbacteria) CG18_big_fil_WC_8_21_14_2_50_49_26]PIW15224.1 MAG: 30S ribosomal protein S15 [bacterium (Candidatus Blackallbacteria) CG17_big_fil_post_rev_8_21_14_2_50_48_46]PIW44811.1 MAG: 30S ribosomal protein S15 [bacterium (Candidatus Blackallbacteria) CG13_big_fil_rev_8_21_14_2_50_49_14]